jgi:predicted  nucleic acid-binding Zn-ribbon protein
MSDVNIQSMIDAVKSDNREAADTAFKNAIMSKITTALDVKRVELASTVYNQANNIQEATGLNGLGAAASRKWSQEYVSYRDTIMSKLDKDTRSKFDGFLQGRPSTSDKLSYYDKLASTHASSEIKSAVKAIKKLYDDLKSGEYATANPPKKYDMSKGLAAKERNAKYMAARDTLMKALDIHQKNAWEHAHVDAGRVDTKTVEKILADIKRKNSGNKQLMDAIAVIEK